MSDRDDHLGTSVEIFQRSENRKTGTAVRVEEMKMAQLQIKVLHHA